MIRRLIALLSLCVLTAAALPAEAGVVTFEKDGDDIVVSIDGEVFSRYHTSQEWAKPFFHPVLMGGVDITRPVDPNEKEHPHHKGIWVSIDEVNGIKFWAEKGKIVNVSTTFKNSYETAGVSDYWRTAVARYAALGGLPLPAPVAAEADAPGEMKVVNHWLAEDGKPAVEEHTRIRIYPNKLMVYDITFKAPGHPVVFEDTKEGLLGFRMAHTMRESEGGHVVSAAGVAGTKDNWGKPNEWIDYYGEVEGKTFGVTLMDHPDNFRASRYHVRNYGLFSISPFGQKAYTNGQEEAQPKQLKPGETLHLRYGLYFHTGNTEDGDVRGAFQQFVAAE